MNNICYSASWFYTTGVMAMDVSSATKTVLLNSFPLYSAGRTVKIISPTLLAVGVDTGHSSVGTTQGVYFITISTPGFLSGSGVDNTASISEDIDSIVVNGDIVYAMSDHADDELVAIQITSVKASAAMLGSAQINDLHVIHDVFADGQGIFSGGIFAGASGIRTNTLIVGASIYADTYNGISATLTGAFTGVSASLSGSLSLSTMTSGSIPYFGGTTLTQDNANFSWDTTNRYLMLNVGSVGNNGLAMYYKGHLYNADTGAGPLLTGNSNTNYGHLCRVNSNGIFGLCGGSAAGINSNGTVSLQWDGTTTQIMGSSFTASGFTVAGYTRMEIKTKAQLQAITPAAGDAYYCSNCTHPYSVFVGTGATIAGFAESGTGAGVTY
jgi:hypothetical protein